MSATSSRRSPRRRRRFPDWSRTPVAERSRILLRIAELIDRDLEKFARAESIDTGKPLALARSLDIPRASSNFRFFATAILHTENEAHVMDGVAFNYTLRQPRGVVGLDLAVEFAALFVELENRAGDRGREHRGRETERADADDGLLVRRNLPRSRSARRRAEHRARHRAERRLADHRASEGRHDFVHRRHRDRAAKWRKRARRCSRKSRSSSAGKIPTSSSPMPISTRRSPAACARRSRTRGRFVFAVRACLSSGRLIDEFVRRFVEKTAAVKSRRSAGRRRPNRARSSRRRSSRR